ncbi:hypothetical protein LTR28_001954 [Elasticomyces elasticus]|nr:hypothetical protein LTR28_001954 [Elasticomyces elasticus]
MHLRTGNIVAALLSLGSCANAISLDVNDEGSIKAAAKTIASSIMGLYNNHTSGRSPGLFPGPYYWWESGLTWDSMVNYWFLTNDTTYNHLVAEALLFQVGPDMNYMPTNQSGTIGNDDQSYWALAAMTAAEQGFPYPTSAPPATWSQLAQNVFDSQVARWDISTCGGGLRWQIYSFNNGYDYKNAASVGNLYQLAARLSRFTGNQTYADWAGKAYDWTQSVGLIDATTSTHNTTWAVYNGTSVMTNCSSVNRIQWSAYAATFLYGSAVMYNQVSLPPPSMRSPAFGADC